MHEGFNLVVLEKKSNDYGDNNCKALLPSGTSRVSAKTAKEGQTPPLGPKAHWCRGAAPKPLKPPVAKATRAVT